MKVGDMIEAHKGERGIILDVEFMYPGNRHSPPRSVKVHWFDSIPLFQRNGQSVHVSGIKRVISASPR